MQRRSKRWWKRPDKLAGGARWRVRPSGHDVHFDPSLKRAKQLVTGGAEPHKAA